MSFDKYKIKIKKINDKAQDIVPQYTLSYRSDLGNAGSASHEILSAFIEKNDVIIEINSDMSGLGAVRNDPVAEFMEKTGGFNLAYTMRNVPSERRRTVFGFSLDSKKKKDANEALVYIPNNIWHHPGFSSFLPVYGAKYYITNDTDDVSAELSSIVKMSEEERKSYFSVTLFDLPVCGRMGILSTHLSMEQINGMLGL